MYWFCHISKWIRHRYTCVPHPEPSSLLSPHIIPLYLDKYLYILLRYILEKGLPRWPSGKEPTCQCRRHKRHKFDPWVGKIPWRRAWQPTIVFLPGKSHGQRSLVGCSSLGRINLAKCIKSSKYYFQILVIEHFSLK